MFNQGRAGFFQDGKTYYPKRSAREFLRDAFPSILASLSLASTARLIILNTCWLALVAWAAIMGYVGFVFTHDISGISYVIAALLAVTTIAAFWGKTNLLPHAKIWFVMLGLIGNLIGFILAIQGMASGSLDSAEGLMTLANALLDGMSVAFCSTLVGAVAALWTSTNSWLLGMAASE